jgi:hypothetical protein
MANNLSMKTIFLTLAFFFSVYAYGQNELSNFSATGRGGVINTFATGYQAIGINPANLGIPGNDFISFSIAEAGMGVSSQSLTRGQLSKFMRGLDEPMSQADKLEFSKAFASENALNTNMDATTLGISFHLPSVGGFGFAHRIRAAGHIGLNTTFAEILFLGANAPVFQNFDPLNAPLVSDVFDGTELQISLLHEFNLAYGRSIVNLASTGIYGGVGYKYIRGVGILDVLIDDGKVRAYSALSPVFNVDYGNLTTMPGFNYEADGPGLLPAVGHGHGFDIGFAFTIGELWKTGISVTDLGFMEWTGNVITAFDQPLQLVTSEGISTFNLFEQIPQFTGAGDEGLLNYQPEQKRRTKLPARLRAGAGLKLSELVETGLDVTIPLNDVAGSLPNTFVGAGVDFKAGLMRFSTGLTFGAGYGFNIPLGLTLVTPIYEAGIATRDIKGYFAQNNPYFSFAFGFLRFKIPGVV